MKKNTTILRAMNDIRADYILESELSAEQIALHRPPTKREAWRRVTSSGWFAAAACAIVAFGTLTAIVLAGQQHPGTTSPAETLQPSESRRYTVQRVNKYSFSYEEWDHEGMVNMDIEIADWADHPENQVFTFKGVEYPLTYVRSLYYPDEDSMMHEYSLDIKGWSSSDYPWVLLTDDGTLFRAGRFDLGVVDMSQVNSDDDLIRFVEEAIADFVDFDSYEHVTITPDGYRRITWYNTLGDYQVPGAVTVGVMTDGSISGLYMKVAHELNVNEADIPTDDEIRALVAEDLQDTIVTLHGPVQLGNVCHKEIIEQNGVECLYIYVEAEYKFMSDIGKMYDNPANFWYIIPIENPDTTTEKS